MFPDRYRTGIQYPAKQPYAGGCETEVLFPVRQPCGGGSQMAVSRQVSDGQF